MTAHPPAVTTAGEPDMEAATHSPQCLSHIGYAESSGHPTRHMKCDCGADKYNDLRRAFLAQAALLMEARQQNDGLRQCSEINRQDADRMELARDEAMARADTAQRALANARDKLLVAATREIGWRLQCEEAEDREGKLREALRQHCIGQDYGLEPYGCAHCNKAWVPGQPERHAEGCLAKIG